MLLEGAPDWLDVPEMQARLRARIPAVEEIHHVHVWGLTPQDLMLTMHLKLCDAPGNQTGIVRDVKQLLQHDYGIGHSTIEVEIDDCSDAGREHAGDDDMPGRDDAAANHGHPA